MTDVSPKAKTQPAKEFFVEMLIRDIDLDDALLDLLDNCVDGIVRQDEFDPRSDRPYEGYRALLSLAPDHFAISDNCGGIPLDVAENSAFAMGRPNSTTKKASSIGLYGIGMKRALFKLGYDARVNTRSVREEGGDAPVAFSVHIERSWMESPDWTPFDIDLDEGYSGGDKGTDIVVHDLREEPRQQFGSSTFLTNLQKKIEHHYALIMAKGLEVRFDAPAALDEVVTLTPPDDFFVLNSVEGHDEFDFEPIVYKGERDGVEFAVIAGMARKVKTPDEIEREDESGDATRRETPGGWTIVCNDRVVLWRDRSVATGWGTAGVPRFHNQFSSVAGIVVLRSADPSKLPLTTTKRGIDMSSQLYIELLDYMRDATKTLTSFTNRAKKPEVRDRVFENAQTVSFAELAESVAKLDEHANVRKVRNRETQRVHVEYPDPREDTGRRRVSYIATTDELHLVGNFLNEEPDDTSVVGRRTFDEVLRRAEAEE